MKIVLPESLKEITLEQYQSYVKILERKDIDDNAKRKRVFALFTGVDYETIEKVSYKDYEEVHQLIEKALSYKPEFEPLFELDGVQYGFINDFDDNTKGEFIAMTKYQNDIQDYHSLMAVMFREVVEIDKNNNYIIKDFDNTFKRAEIFKRMPMHIVDGALAFFLALQKELKSYIQNYTKQLILRA